MWSPLPPRPTPGSIVQSSSKPIRSMGFPIRSGSATRRATTITSRSHSPANPAKRARPRRARKRRTRRRTTRNSRNAARSSLKKSSARKSSSAGLISSQRMVWIRCCATGQDSFRRRKNRQRKAEGNSMQLKGSAFIVTGGASGLGEGTVKMLAEAGANVVIADLQADKGEAIVKHLGQKARFVECDVTHEADGQTAVDAALKNFGALQGLVNCAGIAIAERTVKKDGPHSLASFTRVININLIGTFNMIRLAAVAMAKGQSNAAGERGVIVNTASVAAYDGQIGQAAYSASKGGVVGMTLPIARDLSRDGIRVCTIAPGIFETPMLLGMPKDVQEALAKQVPFPPRPGPYFTATRAAGPVSRMMCSPVPARSAL